MIYLIRCLILAYSYSSKYSPALSNLITDNKQQTTNIQAVRGVDQYRPSYTTPHTDIDRSVLAENYGRTRQVDIML